MSDFDLDETMSDSQQSQYMRDRFPPQGRIQQNKKIDLDEARKAFNDKLIVRNNNFEADEVFIELFLLWKKRIRLL